MERVKGVFKKLKDKLFFNKKPKPSYKLDIPVAGVKRDDIVLDPDEGVIIINSMECILIEEAVRFRSWKMYNSFGFNRSIFLPEGIKIKELETQVKKDRVSITQRN